MNVLYGDVNCPLLMSRSRITPFDKSALSTIPRIELGGSFAFSGEIPVKFA